MKLEIEMVSNGYVVTLPAGEYSEVERKYVVEEKVDASSNDTKNKFQAFSDLVLLLGELFGVQNSKHNKIGFINGLCSEDQRWEIIEIMEKSLDQSKNDLGDEE